MSPLGDRFLCSKPIQEQFPEEKTIAKSSRTMYCAQRSAADAARIR